MKNWRVELTTGRKSLAEVKIQRRIFQGDALSPLIFVIAMILLNHIHRKCTVVYKLTKSPEKNQPPKIYLHIKLFAKNAREIETLKQAAQNNAIRTNYANKKIDKRIADVDYVVMEMRLSII